LTEQDTGHRLRQTIVIASKVRPQTMTTSVTALTLTMFLVVQQAERPTLQSKETGIG